MKKLSVILAALAITISAYGLLFAQRPASAPADAPAVAAPEQVPGNPTEGKAVFEGKGRCLDCHQVYGNGRSAGPDLSAAGRLSAAQLQAKIVNPNAPPAGGGRGGGGRGRGAAGPATITIRLKDGRQYRGSRKSLDSQTVSLTDTDGVYQSFDRSSVADMQVVNASLMPGDYATRLTADEIQNVVAYLKTLDGADPAKLATGPGILSWDRLRNYEKEPQNYTTYWGNLKGTHYSALDQINRANVGNIQAKWTLRLMGTGLAEAIPLVVDGVMYTIGPTSGAANVTASDAKTGRVIWQYQRPRKIVTTPGNQQNRGVAIAGNRVFFGTPDSFLVAIDARNGTPLWEVPVGDPALGYSITSPPLPVRNMIITGISGGELGISGFIEAYDQATGRKLWRFNTVPQPGEPGHETWQGDSWMHGSAPTWLTGSFDADLNTLYWTVGNAGPDYNGDVRLGDNLYSSSVVALDPDTGKLKWHYQFTPNDTHDWDSTEDVILVDRVWHGVARKLLLHADRNGVFYVLDRTNGQFLAANPFVRATWVRGWDEKGRPITTENWRSSPTGARVFPANGGGTNFAAPSYSSQTGWMYFPYTDGSQDYVSAPEPYVPGRQFNGRGSISPPLPAPANEEPPSTGIMALDPETGKIQWKFVLTQGGLSPGLLATAGGVVFAATGEGNFIALDAKTGAALWHFNPGAGISSSPMSYSVDGKQYVAINASGTVYSFALPD